MPLGLNDKVSRVILNLNLDQLESSMRSSGDPLEEKISGKIPNFTFNFNRRMEHQTHNYKIYN